MQFIDNKTGARDAPGPSPSNKLYSLAGQMHGREFAGEFAAKGTKYQFTFTPTAAALSNGKLELTGRLSVNSARGGKRQADHVRATLASTQGGVGPSPTRRQLLAATAQTSQIATPEQKQEQAGEATKPATGTEAPPNTRLPVTESTERLSFVAAMFFRLSPLDGRALGVPIDLSGVQFNARLYPTSDLERELQWLFSALIEAMGGERRNEKAAGEYLKEINARLKG